MLLSISRQNRNDNIELNHVVIFLSRNVEVNHQEKQCALLELAGNQQFIAYGRQWSEARVESNHFSSSQLCVCTLSLSRRRTSN